MRESARRRPSTCRYGLENLADRGCAVLARSKSPRCGISAGFLIMAALSSCETPPPSEPTWEQDVRPLLAARCVRCHTSPPFADPAIQTPERPRVPATRLDVYEVAAMESGLLVSLVSRPEPLFRMPPPPSARLTDYEIEVLRRWDANGPPGMPRR